MISIIYSSEIVENILRHLDLLWQPQAYGPSMIEENRLGVRTALTAENGMHEFFREARILPLFAVSAMK